jgi:outer membrane receptor protein involved in Fe transport
MISRISSSVGVPSKGLRHLFLLCLFLLFGSGMLFSQTVGKLSGTVKDAKTHEALMGCNVTILGTKMGATTTDDGSFFVLNIPPGKYKVQASMIGFRSVIQEDVIINSNRTTVVDFEISTTMYEQNAVVIQAKRPDVEKEKTSTSMIVRSDEVAGLAGMRDVSDVIGLAADVTDGHFRGGREGEELYTLQGMGLTDPLDNSSAFMPIMSAVEEVEVITSGFGAQYGNAQSGVVNITMKEGKSDKWRSTGEFRGRVPGRKHFGPSIYDANSNYTFKTLLNDDAVWYNGIGSDNTAYYTQNGLNNLFGADSISGQPNATKLAAAKALWKQSHKDIGLKYGTDLDYQIEATAGGPLSDKARMFLAYRSKVEWPVLPTDQPETQRQLMGNIVFDLEKGSSLRFVVAYGLNTDINFPSYSSGLGLYDVAFNRVLTVNYQRQENVQLGVRYTKALSQSTFYEIKINTLSTYKKLGSPSTPESLPDSLVFPTSVIDYGKLLIEPEVSFDMYGYSSAQSTFKNDHTRTYSLEGSMTSQVNKNHLINGGIQVNVYSLDVNDKSSSFSSKPTQQIYKVSPSEMGLYIQDKMEFEGMIANVGLRWDFWRSGGYVYADPFSPYKYNSSTSHYSETDGSRKKAPIQARLQPRVGISFPVSETTVFHTNYGQFMQRPSFQYLFSKYVVQASNEPSILGNAGLLPQTTNSYDVGIMQGLGEGFTLDISGYYKDVKNLIEQANFTDAKTGTYTTYYNRDNADIRGFRVSFAKRKGFFTGSVNYQYSVATGKSSSGTDAYPVFSRDEKGNITSNMKNVPMRDVVLGFDRPNNVTINLGVNTPDDFGFSIGDVYPLSNIVLSANSFLRSGLPYTSYFNTKDVNAKRTPAEYNTNLRMSKKISDFFGVPATFYFEVFNVFNDKILNYDLIFQKQTGSSKNDLKKYYETDGLDGAQGIRYWNYENRDTPFAIDETAILYSNTPRSFNFGVQIEL